MNTFDSFIFLLCLVVFLALTTVFTIMMTALVRAWIRLIRGGCEDEKIRKEYQKNAVSRKKNGKFETLFSVLISLSLVFCFAFSLYIGIVQSPGRDNISAFYVVKSGSMSQKHRENAYLFENNLDNQFSTFDLILTHKLPTENELALYDVVIYEVDGTLIIHRIVGIEEPNEKHPNVRHFLLQGDAVSSPDRYPVLYRQMRAMYAGQRIPTLGSFILFMQSPAGYMCIALIVLVNILLPIAEKKLMKEKSKRLALLRMMKKTPKTSATTPLRPIVYYPIYYPVQTFSGVKERNEKTQC